MLSLEEGVFLVRLAREAVENYFLGMETEVDEKELSENLKKEAGAFVTIERYPEMTLRGCIGYIFGIKPLWRAVLENALNAAFNDPRFLPLEEWELGEVVFEVTVLGPLKRIKPSPGNVVVGKHGLLIKKGPYSGVLLPQVPVEFGWDSKKFLEECSMKAGLDKDAWKDSEVYVFEGEIFKEVFPRGDVVKVEF